jgi:hypothetical protein
MKLDGKTVLELPMNKIQQCSLPVTRKDEVEMQVRRCSEGMWRLGPIATRSPVA